MPSDSPTPDPAPHEPRPGRPLGGVVVFALGTFHATLLLVLLVLAAAQTGGTGIFTSLSTGVGFLLFGALWGLSVAATWAATRGVDLDEPRPGRLFSDALAWGAAAGGGFVLLVALGVALRTGEGGLVLFAFFGVIVGAAAGALVGAAFAAIDVAAFAWARAVARRTGPDA